MTTFYMIFRTSLTPLSISVVLRSALRGAVIFGAWGIFTGVLTAVAVSAMARRKYRVPLSLGRTVAYVSIGQSILLIGARLLAEQLAWHRAAVAVHEMPLPLVSLGGAVIVGTGLLILRRTETAVATS
jgi:hypothetical protein